MKKNTKHILFFILFILLLLLFLLLAGYQCPLRFFFGIPCPFCGMTRAFLCVLEGDLAKSFYFHPLWPIVLGIIIIFSSLEIPASSLIGQMDRSWGFCDWNSVLTVLYHKACDTFSHCTD